MVRDRCAPPIRSASARHCHVVLLSPPPPPPPPPTPLLITFYRTMGECSTAKWGERKEKSNHFKGHWEQRCNNNNKRSNKRIQFVIKVSRDAGDDDDFKGRTRASPRPNIRRLKANNGTTTTTKPTDGRTDGRTKWTARNRSKDQQQCRHFFSSSFPNVRVNIWTKRRNKN